MTYNIIISVMILQVKFSNGRLMRSWMLVVVFFIFYCRNLIIKKTVNQGCSASSAKSSRRCQWGLPGGGGQALSSRVYFISPAQTAQHTRDGMSAANKLSASFNPLHLQRGARQFGGQPGASSPWSDKHNCARNRSLIAG